MAAINEVNMPEQIRYWGRNQKGQGATDVAILYGSYNVSPDNLLPGYVPWRAQKTVVHQEGTGKQGTSFPVKSLVVVFCRPGLTVGDVLVELCPLNINERFGMAEANGDI